MALSGQKTIAAAGTPEALGSQQISAPLMVKALPANTGRVYLGESAATVTATTGMVLDPVDVIIFEYTGTLASIWLDSAVNGEGVAWLILSA